MITDRLALRDGRELAWFDLGSPTGRPVVALHGGLVSGGYFGPQSNTARDHNVRLIAVDRPGYGDSTLHREQTYTSASDDIGRIADHLGFDRFGVEEGEYVARQIPGAALHRRPEEGHWLLHSHFAEITSDLVG